MVPLLGPRNPVVFALFHARGGWKGHLVISGVISALLGALMTLTGQLSLHLQWTMSMWANGLLWGQSITLGLTTMGAVAAAVKLDTNNGTLDSLRLMRAGPAAVVMGYLTGGSSVGLAIFTPCLIAGTIASGLSTVGPGPFLWGSLMLTGTAVLLVTYTTFQAFLGVKQGVVGAILGMVILPIGGPLAVMCPPLALLCGPAAGHGAGDMRSAAIDPVLVIAIAAQGALGAIFFVGAMRRFREPGQLAMRRDLGYFLVGLWTATALVAMVLWDDVRPKWNNAGGIHHYHFIGTVAPAMLWGLMAVVASAREAGTALRNGNTLPRGRQRDVWVDPFLVAAIVTLPTVFGLGAVGDPGTPAVSRAEVWQTIGMTYVTVATWFLLIAAVAKCMFARTTVGGVLTGAVAVAILAFAPLCQWIIALLNPFVPFDQQLHIVQFSPIGALSLSWVSLEFPEYRWAAREGVVTCLGCGLLAPLVFRVGARWAQKESTINFADVTVETP